jgi:hypothetical protein
MTSPNPIEELRREFNLKLDSLRQETFMRDEKLSEHASTLYKATESIAQTVSELSDLVRVLHRDVRELREAQAATDRRWNELIDQLTREHKNGGAK